MTTTEEVKPGNDNKRQNAKSLEPIAGVNLAPPPRTRSRSETSLDKKAEPNVSKTQDTLGQLVLSRSGEGSSSLEKPKATFESLPLEIKLKIFQEAFTADRPIQPTEHDQQIVSRHCSSLTPKQKTSLPKRRNPNLAVGLLRTAKWAHALGVAMLYQNNTIDFSETEAGSMSIRSFRRRIPDPAKNHIQHVLIGAKIFEAPAVPPTEEMTGRRRRKLDRARINADKHFQLRTLDGSVIANIARTFKNLLTLEVRTNLRCWSPKQRVHWDLFGERFQSLTVLRPSHYGDRSLSVVRKWDRTGKLVYKAN